MSDKIFKALSGEVMKGNLWKKFTEPTVGRGKTAYPKTSADQEKFGIRFDYDMVVTQEDGTEYHMFKMQANAGKIPSCIKAWRDKHGTDAVISKVLIKKDGTMEEVRDALDAARQAFKNA
ncbi:hypothetical protein CVT25_007938 [Psilocybe cyanescens]|uniref:Uncharacterized protein n=1 Tax=Psilocybe cyanescens TaxID=93625 RepID=A0A409W9H0_PSICY|nr:hypothetical protein CVT25_007938 [Psilocybe cyanescens]